MPQVYQVDAMLARDVSNYSDDLTPEVLEAWRAEGVGLVIIQCFPQTYHQYQEQRAQMKACATAGMPFDGYIFDYLGSPDWLSGALDGLDQADEADIRPRMVWLDEEDVETEAGWTVDDRRVQIALSCRKVVAWTRDINAVGIYTAAWWWVPKMGNTDGFSGYALWAAQYDNIADANVFTPFGGWETCAIKQYAGSQPDGTDLNVLSPQEEQDLLNPDFPGVPPNPIPPDPPDCGVYREAITRGVNRLQIELDRKTAAGKPATLRRSLVREIQAELFGALSS